MLGREALCIPEMMPEPPSKGMKAAATITIMGREYYLFPQTFGDERKKLVYWPGHELVFHVYDRNNYCVGTTGQLSEARRLMKKRGRGAGNHMHICLDHYPRGNCWITARIACARIGRRDMDALRIEQWRI